MSTEFTEFATALTAANAKLAALADVAKSAGDALAVQTRKLNDYWLPKVSDAQQALADAVAGRDACQAKIDAATREHDAANAGYHEYAAKVAEVKRQAREVIAEAEASIPADV